MFSSEDFWKATPKDFQENVEFRLWLAGKCESSRMWRLAMREACKSDILFYVNSWVWQFNPLMTAGEQAGPFISYEYQDKAFRKILWCIEHQKDCVIEKSREMGASWQCLIAMEWLWHWHPWNKFLFVSKSEKAVDDKDSDSLFWKIDFIHRYQPDWLLPGGDRKKGMDRTALYYGNRENGSQITGAASTGDAGVGGRATAMFVDEFSLIRDDVQLYAHSADTAKCRIFNGTHRGMDTQLWALSQKPDIEKLVMHWTDHPRKNPGLYRSTGRGLGYEIIDKSYHFPPDYPFVTNKKPAGGPKPGVRSPWYDEEGPRREAKDGTRAIAMDLDIDPAGSSKQFFNPLMIHELKSVCSEPNWRGEVEHDDDGKVTRLLPKPDGKLKLWLELDGRLKPPPSRYAFGSDVAHGEGATPSCISGVDGKNGKKVLEYKDALIKPIDFANLLVALARYFVDENNDTAMVAWEVPGPGNSVTMRVLELNYRRIYYTENPFKDELRGAKKMRPDKPGWRNTENSCLSLLVDYQNALRERTFINRSEEALNDCLMFKFNKTGKVAHALIASKDDPSGARDNHGDLVIADALAWMMAKAIPKEVEEDEKEEAVDDVRSFGGRMRMHEAKQFQQDEGWVA